MFQPSSFTLMVPERLSPSLPYCGSAASRQDAVGEDGHDGGADEAGDGHSHKPGHEDIPEQAPIHCLP